MTTCPVFTTTDLIGKKWTTVILQEVMLCGDKGFNHIFHRLKTITPKVLSRRLKDFEQQGLVIKQTITTKKPLHTKYSLTKKGKELYEILTTIKKWTTKYGMTPSDCPTKECVTCEYFKEE